MEQQRVGISSSGMGGLFVGQLVASDEYRPCSPAPEERPHANRRAIFTVSRAVWASICCYLLLRMVGLLSGVRGGGATAILLELNDTFDRVWCPLPTWAHIGLVIAAWALFFRVGADLIKTLRSN